jgi:long-chain fatty acid transport protein
MRFDIRRAVPLAVLGAAAALPVQHARAGAYQLHENSTVSLGQAFAGAGSAADTAATVFNNPAGMTQLDGLQLYGGGSLIAPSFTFHGSDTSVFGAPIAGTTNANGGHDAFVPYGYVSYRVNDRVAVGFAMTSPFGLETYYGPAFVGRYQADKTDLTTLDLNPNIALKVTNWLSLGAGFSANRATAEFNTAINSETVGLSAFGPFLPGPLPDGLFHLRDADNWAYGYNLGALLLLDPATRLGITYRSRIQHDFNGTANFTVPYPLTLIPTLQSGPASTKLVLPDTADASLTHVFSPRWTGYADLSWTDWSLERALNVFRSNGVPVALTPENYRNTVFGTIGASYRLNDQITVRGGVGYDMTPTDNQYRDARVPDDTRTLLAVGASYSCSPRTTLDIAYSHVFVASPTIDQVSSTGDTLTGSYRDEIDIVSVGVRSAF